MKEPRIKITFRQGYIELTSLGRNGASPVFPQKIFIMRDHICQEQQELLQTFYERAQNAIVPKYKGKIPYKDLLHARATYKSEVVMVRRVPDSFNKVFNIMPFKAIVDIGTGPGMSVDLTPAEFENEVKIEQLKHYGV